MGVSFQTRPSKVRRNGRVAVGVVRSSPSILTDIRVAHLGTIGALREHS